MPAGKRPQSNTMLYTVITFVGLFIIATVFAIVYYVKFEEQRDLAKEAVAELTEFATNLELNKIGTLVGEKSAKNTWLGTIGSSVDDLASLIVGSPLEEGSAQSKVKIATGKTVEIFENIQKKYPEITGLDPNSMGLIRLTEKLDGSLGNTMTAREKTLETLAELQDRFNDALDESLEKEKTLLAEKDKYRQQVVDIENDYSELKALLEKTTEQQVQTLVVQLDDERDARRTQRQDLLKTEALLKMTQSKMDVALAEVRSIQPVPDSDATAFKADGRIILVDEQTKIVHLNIGTDDGVYQGLYFSVYDKSAPIPRDGGGKAEIEIFNVGNNVSSARIVTSTKKNPIAVNDNVANLIWDSQEQNIFVIAGSFDINGDGVTDYDAVEKITGHINQWGGIVSSSIGVDTDFVILGSAPRERKKPTFEQMELDPLAMDKYEASLEKSKRYSDIVAGARDLSIPVFNMERFLHFIGYKSMSQRPGAFSYSD
jgi:hypothetical protein